MQVWSILLDRFPRDPAELLCTKLSSSLPWQATCWDHAKAANLAPEVLPTLAVCCAVLKAIGCNAQTRAPLPASCAFIKAKPAQIGSLKSLFGPFMLCFRPHSTTSLLHMGQGKHGCLKSAVWCDSTASSQLIHCKLAIWKRNLLWSFAFLGAHPTMQIMSTSKGRECTRLQLSAIPHHPLELQKQPTIKPAASLLAVATT